jgi:hypothetical protein
MIWKIATFVLLGLWVARFLGIRYPECPYCFNRSHKKHDRFKDEHGAPKVYCDRCGRVFALALRRRLLW